jgi:hypothetical protein
MEDDNGGDDGIAKWCERTKETLWSQCTIENISWCTIENISCRHKSCNYQEHDYEN